MVKNSLGIRHLPLSKLKIGESVLLGPYRQSHYASAMWARSKGRFKQRQFLMIDPKTCLTYKFYLVTKIRE